MQHTSAHEERRNLNQFKRMARRAVAFAYIERPKKRRPGVHAKTKSSKLKSSKKYTDLQTRNFKF